MRKRLLIVVSLASSLFAETSAPERKIDNNAIISERDTKLRIELPASVQLGISPGLFPAGGVNQSVVSSLGVERLS
jgi:hypothetical protein